MATKANSLVPRSPSPEVVDDDNLLWSSSNEPATTTTTTADNTEDHKEITVYAPHAGRITAFHSKLQDSIKVGDALLELDDTIENDRKQWEHHVQANNGQATEQFLQAYLQLDDIFRLQELVVLFKEERFLTLLPKASPICEHILELQANIPAEQAQS